MVDLIDASYTGISTSNLIPSFFQFLFGNISGENGNLFGIALILVIAMVSWLMFKSWSNDRAFMVSSLITSMVGFLALKAGWITNSIFVLCLIYVVWAIYKLYDKQGQSEA